MRSHLSGRLPLQLRPSVFSRPRQAVRHQRLLQTPPGLVNLQLLFPASAERHTATGHKVWTGSFKNPEIKPHASERLCGFDRAAALWAVSKRDFTFLILWNKSRQQVLNTQQKHFHLMPDLRKHFEKNWKYSKKEKIWNNKIKNCQKQNSKIK